MTVPAAPGELDPELLTSFFDTVVTGAAAAARREGGWRSEQLRIAGEPVHLRTAGAAARRLVRPLLHLADAIGSDDSAVRLDVVAGCADLPATAWAWTEMSYDLDGDLTFVFDPERRVLVATSRSRAHGVVWFESEQFGAWELAAPLRSTLDRLLAPGGLTMLHAASIGRDGNCALLAGPGGSGKSTAVHAALSAGFETVGDDFVVLPAGGGVDVCNLYCSMRLAHTSPQFDATRHAVIADGFGNEKALVMVDDAFPGALVPRQRVVALVRPMLTGAVHSVLEPTSTSEVLRALLPSSLLLADRQPAALGRLTRFAAQFPAYSLRAGTDVEELIGVVAGLLPEGRLCAS